MRRFHGLWERLHRAAARLVRAKMQTEVSGTSDAKISVAE